MDLTPRMLSLISGALALIPIESALMPIESTPRGGSIGVNANLETKCAKCES